MKQNVKGDILFEGFIQTNPKGLNAFPREESGEKVNHNIFIDHKSGTVSFKDCKFDASGYNCIEGALSVDPEKALNCLKVDCCEFNGTFANVALSFYNFADNAVIEIKDCTFSNVSNVLQLSNNQASHLTVKMEDCTVAKGEANTEETKYRGLILLHDYTSETPEEAQVRNIFGSDLVAVTLKNVKYDDGTILTDTSSLEQGTNILHLDSEPNEHQLIYIYSDSEGLIGDASRYPSVSFS